MCRTKTETEGPTFSQNLGGLLFRDALDEFESTLRCVRHGFDSLVAAVDYELDVAFGEASKTLWWGYSVSGAMSGDNIGRIPRAPSMASARQGLSFSTLR